jgi:hypothetical protein
MFKKTKTGVSAKAASAEVFAKLEAAGCDPIAVLAELATDPNVPLDLRVNILKDLAGYTAPKRRAIDVNTTTEDGLVVKIVKYSSGTKQLEKICDPEVLQEEREKNRIVEEDDYGYQDEGEETKEATG